MSSPPESALALAALNSFTGVTYLVIAAALYHLVRKRKREIPAPWIWLLPFVVGVFLACGISYFLAVWCDLEFHWRFTLKAVTTLLSLIAAATVCWLIPRALDAKRRAEDANRAKDAFIATISHELRTPLTPVLLSLTAMEEEPLRAEQRQTLRMMRANVEMEARLMDDLLDISKFRHDKLALQPEPVDLRAILEKALETARPTAAAQGVRLEAPAPGVEPIHADPARLQQVFHNLLQNALKFTPRGGSVRVRLARSGQTVRVEIWDTGIGIAPALLEKIFDPFEQGAAAKKGYGGLGLGLAISRLIVERHGGTLTASSKGPGRGTVFSITLPVETVGVEEKPEAPETTAHAAPRHILLVEDDANTRGVLERLLARDGHQVTTAASAAEAMRREECHDTVISDIGLPDGSGLEVVREIKKRCPGIYAIALSGYGARSDLRASREAGFAAHLTKPISLGALREALVAGA